MFNLKYCCFFLALIFTISACNFGSTKKEEEEEVEIEITEEEKDEGISININGDEVNIDADKLEESINSSINKMLEGLNNSLKEGERGEVADAVEMTDHKTLKSLLPSRIGWMKQTEYSSEQSGIIGFKVSQAEARYELKDKWIEIDLVDLGGMPLAMFGMSFWDSVEVDRETKEEYEKTYEDGDQKVHEKYNKKFKEGELTTVYKNRYVLAVEGKNVSMRDLESARDKVKLRKLD